MCIPEKARSMNQQQARPLRIINPNELFAHLPFTRNSIRCSEFQIYTGGKHETCTCTCWPCCAWRHRAWCRNCIGDADWPGGTCRSGFEHRAGSLGLWSARTLLERAGLRLLRWPGLWSALRIWLRMASRMVRPPLVSDVESRGPTGPLSPPGVGKQTTQSAAAFCAS